MPNSVFLLPEELTPALDFASAYYGKIQNTGASRDFNNNSLIRTEGDSFADTLLGKFAELMFQKFIKDIYHILLPLDFEIRSNTDGGQDIPGFPLTIDIKATRIYSDYLMVEKQRLVSQVYVMVRVDMPRDIESWTPDVLRYYCGQQQAIQGVICGYAYREDFWDQTDEHPYISFKCGDRLIRSDFFKHIPKDEWTYDGIQTRMREDARHIIRKGQPLKADLNYALPYFKLREDWGDLLKKGITSPDSYLLQTLQPRLQD